MSEMLKRVGIGVGVLLLAMLALLASMVRVHFEPAQRPAAGLQLDAAAPAPPPAVPAVQSDPSELMVPVAGIPRAQIRDTWGESRASGQRLHQGTDIVAPLGTPVIAAAPGTVEKLFYSNGGGGITLYVRSPDRRWSYYYAHLSRYAPGIGEGRQVGAGDMLAYVGDTGNAGAGNYHLHFGVSRMRPEDRWWQGEAINPYPLLAGTAMRR